MKTRILCAFGLGFAAATALSALVFGSPRPAWESIVSLVIVLLFLAGLLKDG